MCGITALIRRNAPLSKHDEDIMQAMTRKLSHRGPDGEGIWKDDRVILGHRRLAVIDLAGGAQPMSSEAGTHIITYNGEIYNYIELRQETKRKGIPFHTKSDTEVLLKLYQCEGVQMMPRLIGMFAFVIYDRARQQIFAARDHFGIKPLYYTILEDGTWLFASEIKAFTAHPLFKAEVHLPSFFEYLTFQFCLGRQTLFRNVYKLPPGSALLLSLEEDRVNQWRYWTPSFSTEENRDEDDFVDELRTVLEDAVRLQMRSDVPIGAHLSGGLDSSIVASLAARHSSIPLHLFNGRFDENPFYDESPYARQVADSIGGHLHLITPTAKDFETMLPSLIYAMDEPAAGQGLFPQYMVSARAREHVKVVLGGQGGDETYGGYARYLLASLEHSLQIAITPDQEKDTTGHVTLGSMAPHLTQLRDYTPLLRRFWSEGLFDLPDERYFQLIDRSHDLERCLHPDLQLQYNRSNIRETFRTAFIDPDTPSYFNRMLRFDMKYLLPALLQVEDRVSMQVSLESRVPLLDHRAVSLTCRMPPSIKFSKGRLKHVLKRAATKWVPKEILERDDKRGFPSPTHEWFQGPLRGFLNDVLRSQRARERNWFNSKEIDKLCSSPTPFDRQLWGVLCLELWASSFLDT
jgi:asparagine synthase (glutamine-hydrolysing)